MIVWNLVSSVQWQQVYPGIFGIVPHVFVSRLMRPMDEAYVRQFVDA